jgi:hypothetical protein
MFYLSETKKRYCRYFSLLAVVILGVVSILGTGGGGDSTPPPPAAPSVDTVFPKSTDAALVTSVVTVQFNTAMDESTLNDPATNFFVVDDSTQIPVPGSVEYYPTYEVNHNYVAVFTPTTDLNINNPYTATVTTDVKDSSGIPLARDYVWSFFTAPAIVPVSTDGTGAVGTDYDGADGSALSATGEYIVFVSKENLAGRTTGGTAQIYRKNTVTGKVDIVSLSESNELANADCTSPRISDTGRFVVFASKANNLDLNFIDQSKNHIYLKDMKPGITDTISLLDVNKDDSTQPANESSSMPDISGIPDTGSGKYVVFQSTASDLHADDTDDISDIFLINFGGTVELISATTDQINNPADGPSYRPRISDDGNRVVFESLATNLVTGDTNGKSDIFLRNLVTDTTTRISIATDGTQATGGLVGSTNADISANGAYAVFQSDQPNLDGDANDVITDIFLRDIDAPSTAILSFANGDANGADDNSTRPSISADGRYIAFESLATDLLGAGIDTNGQSDIFVRDKNSSTIERVSVENSNAQVNGTSTTAGISTDGRYVGFTSNYKFDVLDTNDLNDIYRAYNSALP